jgi:hypothetical protein
MAQIENWQDLANKPVISSDEKEIGIVSDVQSLHLIVTSGPITPDKYNVPKKSVKNFQNGVVYLNVDSKYVEDNYEFE